MEIVNFRCEILIFIHEPFIQADNLNEQIDGLYEWLMNKDEDLATKIYYLHMFFVLSKHLEKGLIYPKSFSVYLLTEVIEHLECDFWGVKDELLLMQKALLGSMDNLKGELLGVEASSKSFKGKCP